MTTSKNVIATSNELTYAIDFGTSNSLLTAADAKQIYGPIPIDPSNTDVTIMRSVFYTPRPGVWHYGASAIQEYSEHLAEGRIFRSIKKYLPEESFRGTDVHGRRYSLSELVAVFLKELRERANAYFDRDVTRVVLGRPAAFSLNSIEDKLAESRLDAAARLAGFKEISFCPEPIAAAHEFRHQLTETRTVLIADFGGGTSDFTVLRMDSNGFDDSGILALGGISVAGDRFDGSIMRHMICPHFGSEVRYRLPMGSNDLRLPIQLINRMCSPADISFLGKRDILQFLRDAQKWSIASDDARCMDRLFVLVEEYLGYKLFQSIERTKINLSGNAHDTFQFMHPGIDLETDISNVDFVQHSQDNVDRILDCLDKTVADAGLTHSDIDIVCCTGGTAKIPALSRELAKRYGAEKLQQHRHFQSVVLGLAEKARALISQ